MTALATALDSFMDSVRQQLVWHQHRASSIGEEIAEALALWPVRGASGSPPTPRRLPAADHLETALDLARNEQTAAVAAAIRAVSPFLKWHYGYPPHPRYPDLGARVAFAQIAGPEDLRGSERLLIGLTLVAPWTLYPVHFHPAVELYLPVGGVGLWLQGDEPFSSRGPGAIILHPENVPHATEAKAEPVLAVYTWRGDLQSKPVYSEV